MKQMMRIAAMGIVGMMVLSAAAEDAYIETGTQAVNTGYHVTSTTRVVMDCALMDNTTKQQRPFGVRGDATTGFYFEFYVNGSLGISFCLTNSHWYAFNTAAYGSKQYLVTVGERLTLSLDAGAKTAKIFKDGVEIRTRTDTSSAVTFTTPNPLMLFWTNNNNADGVAFADQPARLKFYSCQIYEGSTLKMDFWPVRRGGVYMVKDRVSGRYFLPWVGSPFSGGGDIEDEDEGMTAIVPGLNETVNAPAITGTTDVQANKGYGGGIVRLNPYSTYTGATILYGGTMEADNLNDGGVSSLGAGGPLVLGPGTFRYTGPDGATCGRAITNVTSFSQGTAFDVQHDLTLTGKIAWQVGGFVKMGPGTLYLNNTTGGTNTFSRWGERKSWGAQSHAFAPAANGDLSEAYGYSTWDVTDGRVVFNGGAWEIYGGRSGGENWIGKMTKDPVDNAGEQETEAVVEINAGRVDFKTWLGIGPKNGFTTTTPNFVPHSGLIVNGGTVIVEDTICLGRNTADWPQKDAGGNFIPQRTHPFLEVHGGSLECWNTFRICDDPGADSTVFIDGGKFTVYGTARKTNPASTTGTILVFGNCNTGDTSAPRNGVVTVCTNGILNITQFYIVGNSQKNITATLNVLDGGRFQNNQLRKGTTNASCEMYLFFDGGIIENRWGGYTDFIKGDVTRAEIGTHGVTFRSLNGCKAGSAEVISASFQARNSHPDEEPQGVTITTENLTKNSSFRFTAPQAWAGPTRILAGGVCELAGTGAFPPASAVTLAAKGRMTLLAASQTFPSLALGLENTASGAAVIGLAKGLSVTAGAFSVVPGTTLAFDLYETVNLNDGTASDVLVVSGNPLTTAGTYTLLTVPAANADDLEMLAGSAVVRNAASGTAYAFDVETSGATASLRVTVGAGPAAVATTAKTWSNAAGGTWSEGTNWSDGSEANGAGAVATFSTEAAADGTAVTVDAPKTVGGLAFSTANAYALSGGALTLANGASPATVTVTAGGPTIANALALQGGASVRTSGGTTLGVSGAVTGAGAFTSNAGGAGSGQVTLGDALSGFGGTFTTGGGVTHLSSLAFAATLPTALTLGYGTLHYTGTGETLAGAYLNPGASKASILTVDNDLTLRSMSVGTGGLIKKGAGDLVFKGNGSFELGNIQVDYSADKAQGITATGESPNNAVTGTLLADGRLVIGTKGDDSDAPYVTTAHHITLGGRTTDWNSWANGVCEKAGELVLNNGFVDMRTSLWIGYYCGVTGSTDPANPPHGKLTVNGGVFSATAIEMLRDWQGYQTIQAEIEQNGGVIRATGSGNSVVVGTQIATNGATAKITINDGLFDVAYDVLMGNAANTGPGTFTVNGGEVRCGHYFRVGNNATAGRQELHLNGGVLTCMHLDHVGAANATDRGSAAVYFDGGVLKLGHNRTQGWGSTIGSETKGENRFEIYVGERGAIFDFTEWEKCGEDNAGMNIRNRIDHDPACAGTDGGLLFRGRGAVSFRAQANGSTFTGPIRLEDRFALSIDNGWTGYLTTPVICGQGTSLRISNNTNTINTVTLGEAGGTVPVVIDFCSERTDTGLFAFTKMEVLSPVTVAFHRPGGSYNAHGMQDGTYPVVYYKPADEANVPLDLFVANPNFPEKSFTYVKEDVTSGPHAGLRVVKVTIAPTDAAATVWTSVAAGGDWHDAANWNGGVPPEGTNSLALFNPATAANVPVNVDGVLTLGTATLKGANAGAGYTVAGGAINLNHRDTKSAPGFAVESGTHEIAANLTTDDYYQRSNETDANNGYSGAIGVYTASGATARVTGTLTMDSRRPLRVNTPKVGGGTTTFVGTIAQGSGVWVDSGTLEIADMSKLNGKTLTVGSGTFHYTGPEAISSAKVVTRTDNGSRTAIIRLDNDLLLTDRFDSQMGGVMKTGPGTLTLAPNTVATATNHLGWYGHNTEWNRTGSDWYWPANGDSSAKQGAGALCIDEGEIVIAGGSNSLFHMGDKGNGLDVFIGANDRGWGYATNYAALTIRSGTVKGAWVYLGHTFNHGKDGSGHLIPTYSCYNQHGGNVTFAAFCFGYDYSDYDTACQSTANIYGGTLSNTGVMRFGQVYNKTGINPPHATFNMYGGTYNHTLTGTDPGTRMGWLNGKADGQNTLNRASDATLNIFGGQYNEAERIHMGCNASTSRLNLYGGVLKAENIFLNDASYGTTRAFFGGGKAYVYWNGGTYAPVGTTAANQTLTGLTEVLVSTNGAVVTTESLVGESYTIAQSLLHDPDLEGTDGGFVKKGAKPLALAGANTYTGDTVVEEGTLMIPVGANASALPADSAVVVAEGATLEMASGTAARAGGLRVDMDTTYGTLAGFAPAADGTLYVTGVGDATRKGLVLPVTVTDAQQPNKLTRWAVYVDGDRDDSLSAFVRKKANSADDTIVLDGRQGLYLIVR